MPHPEQQDWVSQRSKIDASLEQAREAQKRGDHYTAGMMYQLAENPEKAFYFFDLAGQESEEQGNYIAAQDAYEAAAGVAPDDEAKEEYRKRVAQMKKKSLKPNRTTH